MLLSVACICIGASMGAILRWLFNLALNPIFAALPLGTLAVNWLGGLIMGLALAFFAAYPGQAPQWRLLLITGFLGSFTTFSAFSAEMANLINQGRPGLLSLGILLHVGGSICMVFLGMALFGLCKKLV